MDFDEYWEKSSEEWKHVLGQEFVNIGVAIEKTNSPKEAINALFCWWQSVAVDPRVSEDARKIQEDSYKLGWKDAALISMNNEVLKLADRETPVYKHRFNVSTNQPEFIEWGIF